LNLVKLIIKAGAKMVLFSRLIFMQTMHVFRPTSNVWHLKARHKFPAV